VCCDVHVLVVFTLLMQMSTADDRSEAASRGDLAYLKQHVVVGNVEEGAGGGWRVIHEAASEGHLECVEWLVEKMEADVDAKSDDGSTPLSWAAFDGQVDVCHYLLQRRGVSIDEPDDDQRSPLHWAIRNNHKECARLLINSGARISNVVLDNFLPCIPDWAHQIVANKEACRSSARLLMGLYRKRRVAVFKGNGYDAIYIIARILWGARMDGAWERVAEDAKTRAP